MSKSYYTRAEEEAAWFAYRKNEVDPAWERLNAILDAELLYYELGGETNNPTFTIAYEQALNDLRKIYSSPLRPLNPEELDLQENASAFLGIISYTGKVDLTSSNTIYEIAAIQKMIEEKGVDPSDPAVAEAARDVVSAYGDTSNDAGAILDAAMNNLERTAEVVAGTNETCNAQKTLSEIGYKGKVDLASPTVLKGIARIQGMINDSGVDPSNSVVADAARDVVSAYGDTSNDAGAILDAAMAKLESVLDVGRDNTAEFDRKAYHVKPAGDDLVMASQRFLKALLHQGLRRRVTHLQKAFV